jgi:hypothetical protein
VGLNRVCHKKGRTASRALPEALRSCASERSGGISRERRRRPARGGVGRRIGVWLSSSVFFSGPRGPHNPGSLELFGDNGAGTSCIESAHKASYSGPSPSVPQRAFVFRSLPTPVSPLLAAGRRSPNQKTRKQPIRRPRTHLRICTPARSRLLAFFRSALALAFLAGSNKEP